jgi:hypothetical protein
MWGGMLFCNLWRGMIRRRPFRCIRSRLLINWWCKNWRRLIWHLSDLFIFYMESLWMDFVLVVKLINGGMLFNYILGWYVWFIWCYFMDLYNYVYGMYNLDYCCYIYTLTNIEFY